MVAKKFLAAALSAGLAASGANAEDCVAGWENESGRPETQSVALDLSNPAKLERKYFPQSVESIVCARTSIVPLPADIRVLIELGVAFGVADGTGRSLWIYAENGLLKTELDDGKLSPTEKAGVKAWLNAAQVRVTAALSKAGSE